MLPPFEEALGDLLAEYSHYPIDDLISAMELQLAALHEQAKFEATPAEPR